MRDPHSPPHPPAASCAAVPHDPRGLERDMALGAVWVRLPLVALPAIVSSHSQPYVPIPKDSLRLSARCLDGAISKFKALLFSRCEKEAAMHQDRWRTKA